MVHHGQIERELPELESITDIDLRDKVVDIWVDAIDENGYTDVHSVPRSNTCIPGEDLNESRYERLLPHVRDVAAITLVLSQEVERRFSLNLNQDIAVAGALLHDISKIYEFGNPEIGQLIDHPYYSVYLLERMDMPRILVNVVLSHSPYNSIEPRSMEAMIVHDADRIALNSLYWMGAEQFHPDLVWLGTIGRSEDEKGRI